MNGTLNKFASVQLFNKKYSCDIVDELYSHFKYLCNFTHGRPCDKVGLTPTNSINLGCDTPEFEASVFPVFIDLILNTISWIATIWLITFPAIVAGDPLNDKRLKQKYESLLIHQRGRDALTYSYSLQ